MPALDWEAFAKLPGSPEKNFELLCRGVIRQNFGSYGVFRALANQPGVEFHLKIERRCDTLGDPGRWWGWQCRWYDLPAGVELGSARRAKIEDAIRKTNDHLPGVTDWVLWTRRTLTKTDQRWFDKIRSKMQLQLWTGDEVDIHLSGQAAVLRSTYFGELVLTPEFLHERHLQSVAPIRTRWQPDVHQVLSAERELRRMLGESGSWRALRVHAKHLLSESRAVDRTPPIAPLLTPLVSGVAKAASRAASALKGIADGISNGDLDLLRDELARHSPALAPEVTTAPRRLRSINHVASLHVTNAVGGCRESLKLVANVESAFASRLVAVLAPAGCGKTHLAAQLTVGTDTRPHGVLLHGRYLHANHTLDDLARRFTVAAQPVQTMEALLAAVDAAGQRARHRLPVVIDGLNESEDPRAWKAGLAELEAALARYPYVLLVCTLRPEFAADTLPEGVRRIEIPGYADETTPAIQDHFRYYKIEPADASIPFELLRHPLTLRLFCEVTNPTREKVVGIDTMLGSLTALFDRYLEQAGKRIVELASRSFRYYEQDVRQALDLVGSMLWDKKTRSLGRSELRQALRDEARPWDQSLVSALEQEGVLLRMPSEKNDAYVPASDRMGGHIIASALLARHGQGGFEAWIRAPQTTKLLAGAVDERTPLADDVVYSLVGQLPRRLHSKQLWQLVEGPLRARSLLMSAELETAYLDTATVDSLCDLVRQGDIVLLEKLWETRGIGSHPLNADAMDRVLRPMAVADRDLCWSEWIRSRQQDVLQDLKTLEMRWRQGKSRSGDRLRARWIMWTLTSTVRQLRDQATRCLFWFGRRDPDGLFELAIDSLAVNDTYVTERMLAATYGVVMSHQRTDKKFGVSLNTLLKQLADALVGVKATTPTNHYLARLYVRGIIAFATKFYEAQVPSSLRGNWVFAMASPVESIAKGDPRVDEVGRTLHMDFDNYTLGRLFDDRSNYDGNHQGHQAAVAHVRGVVWSLGWRAAGFKLLDERIDQASFRSEGRGDTPQSERYGKKYGWIGFFTYAGILEAQGLLPRQNRRLSDVDIDPSFPERPPMDGATTVPQAWLKPGVESHERWICESGIKVPQQLIVRDQIGAHVGPWIAVHGSVRATDKVLGREAWCSVSTLIVPTRSAPQIVNALNSGKRPWGVHEAPKDYYTFAGEIPWHKNFAAELLADSNLRDYYREHLSVGRSEVEVETLAHHYAWESYHSKLNQAGSVRVPSFCFSAQFDLRSVPQGFDQVLPNGTRASITLSGVDGLQGDILYLREDLLRLYVGDRAIIWFAFGERELHPYPSTRPQWLVDAQRTQADGWRVVLTEADLSLRTAGKVTKKAKMGSKDGAVTKKTKAHAKRVASRTVNKKTRSSRRKR